METTNPFYERGVIRDPKRFFGRKSELKQIFERLATMQSVSIVGERRIGKSSLLAYITATGRERLGQDYELYTIDLQRVENTADFLARALDALAIKDGRTVRDFEKALEGRKVIMCLDEFEQSSDFSKEFFNILRSLASTGHLALVTVSQTKLAELASEGLTTSPFFNIFTTVWLTELSEAECGEVLNGLAQSAKKGFAPAQIAAAYHATHGNPWRLQIYGYYLYQTDGDLSQTTKLYQTELGHTLALPTKSAMPAETMLSSTATDSTEFVTIKAAPAMNSRNLVFVLFAFSIIIGLISVLANSVGGLLVAIVALLIGGSSWVYLGYRSVTQLEIGSPELASDMKKQKSKLLVFTGLILTLIIFAGLGATYVTPTSSITDFDSNAPNLQITLTYPTNLAIGDVGSIDFTIANLSTQPITGTFIILFKPDPPIHLIDGTTTILRVENLIEGERQSTHIRFQIAILPWFLNSGRIEFVPHAELDGHTRIDYNIQFIGIAPFPYLRIVVTGAFGIIGVLIWELVQGQVKKSLGLLD